MVQVNELLKSSLAEMQFEVPLVQHLLNESTLRENVAAAISARDGDFLIIPANKRAKHERGETSREDWESVKPARLLRRLMPEHLVAKVADAEFEVFANKMKGVTATIEDKVKIVEGDELLWAYHGRNRSAKETGSLRGSCMNNSNAQEWLRLYADNPERVRLVMLPDELGKVEARALLWLCDSGITFMDRVYGSDAMRAAFREVAKLNGWWYRVIDSYADKNRWEFGGIPETRAETVTLQRSWGGTGWPYVDTFSFFSDREPLTLRNTLPPMGQRHGTWWSMQSTTGGRYME